MRAYNVHIIDKKTGQTVLRLDEADWNKERRVEVKAYEGMKAFQAGIEEGRAQVVNEFNVRWRPRILNMLALISETSEEDSTIELANDIYNYIIAVDIDTFTVDDESAGANGDM